MATQHERSAAARRKLIDATIALVAEHGVGNTSVAAIGEHAGMSRGAVNFHFGSKDDLLTAVADEVTDSWERVAEELSVDPSEPALVRERLQFAMDNHIRQLKENPERFRIFTILFYESLGPLPHLHEHFASLHRRVRQRVESMIESAQADGEIPTEIDACGVATFVLGAFRGIGFQYLLDPEHVDLERAYSELRLALTQRFGV